MQRRDFVRVLAAASLSGAGGAARPQGGLMRFTLSERGCGRATGYAETNKIVTWHDKTHVAWLDSPPEGFRVRARTLDRLTGEWSPTCTVGEAFDNHGGPALTVDGEGYLHIVYYPHHHPFRYRRSQRPNDASAWTDEVQFGKRCTYPCLICGQDGTLYLSCRESTGTQWTLNLYRKAPGHDWEGPTVVLHGDAPGGYTRWQASLAFGRDHHTIHMGFMIYEGQPKGNGYLVGYLQSPDGGVTWGRSDGVRVMLPATPATVEAVASADASTGPQNFRPGSTAVDLSDRPWLIYSRLDTQPYAAWLACLEGPGRWRHIPLLEVVQERWLERAVQTPGEVVFGQDGTMYVAVTTVRADSDFENSFWGDTTDEVALLVSTDEGASFTCLPISEADPTTPNWLPSLERPTGHNVITLAGLVYTSGPRGDGNQQLLSNRVVWVDCAQALRL